MTYPVLGDFELGKTIFFPFHTFNSSGASVTLTGLATSDILVYKNASMTQRSSTAGFTLVDTDGIDIDSVTGLHGFTIDTSDNTDAGFYAAGNDYTVVVSTVTIDSQTVTFIAGRFSIINRAGSNLLVTNGTLSGTHSSTTMDLGTNAPAKDIGGCVVFVPARQLVCYVDSYNTGTGVVTFSPSTSETLTNGDAWYLFAAPKPSTGVPPAVNLTQANGVAVTSASGRIEVNTTHVAGTSQTAGDIVADTNDIQARLPAALVSGRIDASVGAMATDTLTSAALASSAGTEIGTAVWANATAATILTKTQADTTRYIKNTASQKVFFTLVDSTDHVTRKTGITVTAQRSLDGAALGSATGTVTEVGNGVYYLSASAADTNADDVVFRFTGTACDPVELHVVTSS